MIKAVADAGADSITLYEIIGWRGVMETETGSTCPEKFPSMPGWVFPLYHVLADVGEFAGGSVLPWTSGNSLILEGIGITKDNRTRVLLANLTDQVQKVRLACPRFRNEVRVKRLDETNVMEAMSNPEAFRADIGVLASGQPLEIDLQPYAVCRVDG